jgi:adhesin transport system membrane fusion protein
MSTAACPNKSLLPYYPEAEAARLDRESQKATFFLLVCLSLVVSFAAWAYFATLEEITRGDGQVIPSSKKQVVQSLEGGIVKAILVKEGARVKRGQILLRIDDTGFSSDLGEQRAKALALEGQIARLKAEIDGRDLPDRAFPEVLKKNAPMIVENEKSLYRIRKANLLAQVSASQEKLSQRHLELAELRANQSSYRESLSLARDELRIKQPLARKRIVPQIEILQLKRTISDLKGQLDASEQAIPRLEAGIREIEQVIKEQKLSFRQEAQKEYNDRRAELSVVQQTMRAAGDRVKRTDIRSPVSGIINALRVTTLGGVVRAADPLVEITPIEDTLLVEAKIRPQDIAFISPNQKALVKLTAYDFTIYGGLDGKVELISADTQYDEERKEYFYHVTIRTTETTLKKNGEVLPIIPGMIASVDILTGEKTVLDYLLKPINKARQEAMTER